MGLTLIYCSFFESTYKKPSFIKVAIFSDVILVSSYPSCNRKTINLIPHYMIRDRSYLEKLQIIQNINNLMFQVIFIFSDWRVEMPRFNAFSRNVNAMNLKFFPTHGGIYKLEKIQQAFWREIKPLGV